MCGKEAQRELARGDKIIVLVRQLAIYLQQALGSRQAMASASASASLLKSSLVLDKSEWVKGQTLRQPSVSVVRCHPTAPSALTIRAGSYADELVKTAVRLQYPSSP